MLQEAIEHIQSLGADAAEATCKVEITRIDGDPRHVYVKHGKSFEKVGIPAAVKDHKLLSVENVIEAANNAVKDGSDDGPEVWHSPNKIVIVMDSADRRDRATMTLEVSPQYWTLCQQQDRKEPMNQKRLIDLLRIDLYGCIALPGLLAAVRRIKFKSASSGEGNIQHGSESLGKSVEAEVSGVDGTIPDEVVVMVPVYKNFGEAVPSSFPVHCALDIDAANQTFLFRPFPGELTSAMNNAQQSIGDRLKEGITSENVPVYFGEP